MKYGEMILQSILEKKMISVIFPMITKTSLWILLREYVKKKTLNQITNHMLSNFLNLLLHVLIKK